MAPATAWPIPDVWQAAGRAGGAAVTAFFITFLLTPLVRAIAVRGGWISRPVDDRWGRRIVARLGGVAIFLGFLGAALLWPAPHQASAGLFLGAGLVFLLGLWDDVRRMAPYTKLVGQLLIGCLVVAAGIRIELIQWSWLSIPLSVLWLVLIMNAFNLLDNMDGLAAGCGALAAAFCAVHASLAGQWSVVWLCGALVGACAGFLRFNFPPAKVFMGDSGSHFLGSTLAILALMGSWQHSTQLLSVLAVPVFVLAVPIFDTCFVTIQRLAHRQHPFTGGRDHLSHRLAILGLSTRQTVLALYAVSLGLGVLSVLSRRMSPFSIVAVWLAAFSALLLIGAYLARVNVYRIAERPESADVPAAGGPVTLIETMLLHKRRLLEILVDFCVLSGVYVAAHLLRFEGSLAPDLQLLLVQSLPIILVTKLGTFAAGGLYRGQWRYMDLADALQVFRAVTLASMLSALTLLYLWRFEGYSRAVLIIDWLLTFFGIAGARVVERLLNEGIQAAKERALTTVIIGAGDTGERVLRFLRYEGYAGRRIVGFLDDDARKQHTLIHGVPVLGTRARLPELLATQTIREVLVAVADPPGDLLQFVRQHCQPLGVAWKVVTAGVTDAV
jgi:UDP-GlcNAc:undecaprenyl-phosphate GlcNAc-1-phosphate transferase